MNRSGLHLPLRPAVIFLLAGLVCTTSALAQPNDLIILNGRLLDGSGNPWRRADIAVRQGRIVLVGDLSGVSARRTIDAEGLYLAPGFIDVHSHAAGGLASQELSEGRPLLAQGITTVVVNPDGGGPVDLSAQRQSLLEHGLGLNVALMVPHGSVRRRVLGMEDRAPTEEELERMKELVRQGMRQGAFGLSSGLYYAPGSYAATEEVIELAKVASAFRGVYSSHIRDEADYNIGLVGAVDEVIRIAEEARLPGIVSHIKALGPRVWGFSQALVQRIEGARERGVEVYADQYPYQASGTGIVGALIPRWALAGGRGELQRRLADPTQRARLRQGILENLDRRGGAGRLQIRSYQPDPSLAGRTLAEVALQRSLAPADLVLQLIEAGDASLVSYNMNPQDVHTLMRHDWAMTSSDGSLSSPGRGLPHPRSYGTYPRKIRRYVLEEKVIGLTHAIRSMTSLPASVFGMQGRGVIRAGAVADLLAFDLEKVRDRASYQQPHQLSEGMVHVLVNGVLAVEGGKFTGAMSGRVLRRNPETARSPVRREK